jgi:hypothetical protein
VPTPPASDGGDRTAPQPQANPAWAGELNRGEGTARVGPSVGPTRQARMCRLDLNQDSEQFMFEFETQHAPVSHNGKELNAYIHLDISDKFFAYQGGPRRRAKRVGEDSEAPPGHEGQLHGRSVEGGA